VSLNEASEPLGNSPQAGTIRWPVGVGAFGLTIQGVAKNKKIKLAS
jgi:hypothetical protein